MNKLKQYSMPLEDIQDRREEMDLPDQELISRAIRCLEEKYLVRRDVINSPQVASDFVRLHLTGVPYEVFAVLWLDARMRLIRYEELFRGTIDSAHVHPREVVRTAIQRGAAACILCHNHPSGDSYPSQADKNITRKLREVLALVDVSVKDHLVVGDRDVTSFADIGLL
jgi:DNA repair protein RadC